ncbi:hypothetical protein NM688_g6 [Phlebia brevispora]|uniref:Uncharacterized protein n=1 Tax=Phlebia brevispora TaxID=194682 RepID=A0ACC1TG86_9APHY|nr:hypothetical protein NM688_g6 [Phlebia brevispora]
MSIGHEGMPHTLTLALPPSYPIDFKTTWFCYLPSATNPQKMMIGGIRAACSVWAEYVVVVASESRPFYLHIKLDHLEPMATYTQQRPLLLCRYINPLMLSEDFEDLTEVAMQSHPVLIKRIASSVDASMPNAWLLRATSMTLMVGMSLNLICLTDDPVKPQSLAKIVGIQALEQDWLEFVVEMRSSSVALMGGRFIYLITPFSSVTYDALLTAIYTFYNYDMPTALTTADFPPVLQLSPEDIFAFSSEPSISL